MLKTAENQKDVARAVQGHKRSERRHQMLGFNEENSKHIEVEPESHAMANGQADTLMQPKSLIPELQVPETMFQPMNAFEPLYSPIQAPEPLYPPLQLNEATRQEISTGRQAEDQETAPDQSDLQKEKQASLLPADQVATKKSMVETELGHQDSLHIENIAETKPETGVPQGVQASGKLAQAKNQEPLDENMNPETDEKQLAEQNSKAILTQAGAADDANPNGQTVVLPAAAEITNIKEIKPQASDEEKKDLEAEQAEAEAEKEALAEAVPIFNAASEIKKLSKEIETAKATLRSNEQQRSKKIDLTLAAEKKAIDTALQRDTKTTGQGYDAAIEQVKKNVSGAKKRIENERKAVKQRIKNLCLDKTDELDEVTDQKVQAMVRLGESYAKRILTHGYKQREQANINLYHQKVELNDKVKEIAAYKSYQKDQSKVSLIRGELQDMADGAKEKMAEANTALLETLREDGETFAQEFRDEAQEGAEKLPEGKEDVADKFTATRDEMLRQIDGMGHKEVDQLEKEAAKTIANLRKEKSEALAALRKTASEAKTGLDNQARTTKEQLAEGSRKMSANLDKSLQEAQSTAPTLADQLAWDLIAQVRGLKDSTLKNDKAQGATILSNVEQNLKKAGKMTVEGLGASALTATKSAADVAQRYRTSSDKIANSVIDGMKQCEATAENEMSKVLKQYVSELDKTIGESDGNWNKKLTNGKATMDEKVESVRKENHKVARETMKEMPGRASYLWRSTSFDRFLDGVVGFLEGIWEGLMELVSGLLTVLLYVLIAVAALVLLVALIAGIAFLLGGLGALAGVLGALGSVISAIGAVMAVLGPILLWVGIAMGVAFFSYAIYEAATTKGLSGKDRWKIIGKGFFDGVTSIELGWLSKMKFFKGSKNMKLWGKFKNLFGKSEKAKSVVRFFNGSVEKAQQMVNQFGGKVKEFEAMYKKFLNGHQMESMMKLVGNDGARLERLMAKCGDDPAKLRKVLRRMSPEQFEDSMKHFDNADDLLAAYKKSGGDADDFLKGLNMVDDKLDDAAKHADEHPNFKEDGEAPSKKTDKEEDAPENKKQKENEEAEKMKALAQAKALVTIANETELPLASLRAQLTALDAQYDEVDRFEYRGDPREPDIWLIGSAFQVKKYSIRAKRSNNKPISIQNKNKLSSIQKDQDGLRLVETNGKSKTDYLVSDKSEAMNWARSKLGHNTKTLKENPALPNQITGWENPVSGDRVYWNHGDWYTGAGKSQFPHINYSFNNGQNKGHLFLEDKIITTGLTDSFISTFNL